MKPSRALSRFLIRDLAKFSGMRFEFHDRLTRTEALAVTDWARQNPDVVKAYIDKGHPEHGAVKLFADTVRHFQFDHPEAGFGVPAPWPDKSTERPIGANPFHVETQDEAAAFLAWAQTVPEYRDAYMNKEHPQHADYVQQTQELMALGLPPTPAADAGRAFDQAIAPTPAAPPAAPVAARPLPNIDGDRLSATIRELQKKPAYLDGKHPDHAATVAAVKDAYSARYPEPPGAPADLAAAVAPVGTGTPGGAASGLSAGASGAV